MEYGTLTITGKHPLEIDGLSLGYSDKQAMRFRCVSDGFLRAGTLFKTLDPAELITALGIVDATYNITLWPRHKWVM